MSWHAIFGPQIFGASFVIFNFVLEKSNQKAFYSGGIIHFFWFFLVEKTLKMLVSFFVLAQLFTLMGARKCGESVQCHCSRDTSWIVCANVDSAPIFTLPVKELRRLHMTTSNPENFDYGQVLINRQLLLPPEVPLKQHRLSLPLFSGFGLSEVFSSLL